MMTFRDPVARIDVISWLIGNFQPDHFRCRIWPLEFRLGLLSPAGENTRSHPPWGVTTLCHYHSRGSQDDRS